MHLWCHAVLTRRAERIERDDDRMLPVLRIVEHRYMIWLQRKIHRNLFGFKERTNYAQVQRRSTNTAVMHLGLPKFCFSFTFLIFQILM